MFRNLLAGTSGLLFLSTISQEIFFREERRFFQTISSQVEPPALKEALLLFID